MFVCLLQGARGNDGAAGAAGPPVSPPHFQPFPEFQNTLRSEALVFSLNIQEPAILSFA